MKTASSISAFSNTISYRLRADFRSIVDPSRPTDCLLKLPVFPTGEVFGVLDDSCYNVTLEPWIRQSSGLLRLLCHLPA